MKKSPERGNYQPTTKEQASTETKESALFSKRLDSFEDFLDFCKSTEALETNYAQTVIEKVRQTEFHQTLQKTLAQEVPLERENFLQFIDFLSLSHQKMKVNPKDFVDVHTETKIARDLRLSSKKTKAYEAKNQRLDHKEQLFFRWSRLAEIISAQIIPQHIFPTLESEARLTSDFDDYDHSIDLYLNIPQEKKPTQTLAIDITTTNNKDYLAKKQIINQVKLINYDLFSSEITYHEDTISDLEPQRSEQIDHPKVFLQIPQKTIKDIIKNLINNPSNDNPHLKKIYQEIRNNFSTQINNQLELYQQLIKKDLPNSSKKIDEERDEIPYEVMSEKLNKTENMAQIFKSTPQTTSSGNFQGSRLSRFSLEHLPTAIKRISAKEYTDGLEQLLSEAEKHSINNQRKNH